MYINCTPKHQKAGSSLSVTLPKNQGSDHWKYETTCLCDLPSIAGSCARSFLPDGGIMCSWYRKGSHRKTSTGYRQDRCGHWHIHRCYGLDTACHLEVLGGSIDIKKRDPPDPEETGCGADGWQTHRIINRTDHQNGKETLDLQQTLPETPEIVKSTAPERAAALKQWQEQFANTLLEKAIRYMWKR